MCIRDRSITASDSIKQVEVEFLTSPNGILKLIELIKSCNADDPNVLSTLRIYDLEKVKGLI